MKLYIILYILISPTLISAYKILGVFPTYGKSHFIVGEAFMKALHNAGHEVAIISPYEQKVPLANWTDIPLDGYFEKVKEKMKDFSALRDLRLSSAMMLKFLFSTGTEVVEYAFEHKHVKLAMKTEKYDLILVEIFGTEACLGLGEYYQAPIIGISTFGSSQWTNNLVGSPAPLSYVPHPQTPFTSHMTFWERIINVLTTTYETLLLNLYHYPNQAKLFDKYFPNAKLSFYDTLKNVSMVMLNSHFSIGMPQPYVPNMVEVGGIHIDRLNRPLAKDIQQFLDSASENGVIYFSMGSIIKSTEFSAETRELFSKAFSKLKQKVLWKFEDESIKMPSNILVKNWFPQNDILAHSNVKLFISHGGLLGVTEAIYHAVPLLGIPIFADQNLNINHAQNAGYALKLDFMNITYESISWSLNEILNNPKYSVAAKKVSSFYRDQPMTPAETVVYWAEYVIRHQGASHLHSAGLELTFMQYHCIDILLTIICFDILIIFMFYKAIKYCCCSSTKTKTTIGNLPQKKRI